MTFDYAKCVVRRQARRASEAVVRNVDNAALLRDYPQLRSGECLGKHTAGQATMKFTGDLYRYALADALVNLELAGLDPPDLSAVPPLSHREESGPPQRVNEKGKKLSAKKYEAALKAYNEDVGFAFISRLGECGIWRATREAKALLRTVPGTAEETAQLKVLAPSLAYCLQEGDTLRFGPVVLRGTIAINYYRLVQAARSAQPERPSDA